MPLSDDIIVKRSQPITIPSKSHHNFNPVNKSPNRFVNKLERRYKEYYNNMSPVLILSNK